MSAVDDPVEFYVTAKDTGDRLARKAPIPFEPAPHPDERFGSVMVDPSKAFQTIVGIGGALTDASAETYAKLPTAKQQELMTAYFDPVDGIGYSLARTHIHSCDFSSASYSYVESTDPSLASFSIDRDRHHKLPFIITALANAKGGLRLFASPWSPPAWMKTNDSMLQGGSLKPEYRDAWARYYVRFVQEYEKAGVPIWGLTVQNEPMSPQVWESCLFTAEEERDFVRDHLGPTLEAAGLARLKLMIWDHNRGMLYQRVKVVYDDPQAARFVWGAGFHWYVGDHWDNVRVTHDAWPDKALMFTEGTARRFEPGELKEWRWGEAYGESIIRDLNNWAAGWTDWNVLLDQRGGPNHVDNFRLAPVHAETTTGELTYTSSYWYIGHLSKFVRPGARRIACTSNKDALLAAAFRNPDGRVAVVVMNKSNKALPFQLWIDGHAAKSESPARSIVTFLTGSTTASPWP